MIYDMKKIQRRLNELGFRDPRGKPLVVDGIAGPNTSYAIIQFKKSVGLAARDYVGPLTYEALMQGTATDTFENTTMPWMAHAIAMKTIHEKRDYNKLKKWFSKTVAWIDPREIAWCGAFVETCIRMFEPERKTIDNPLGARGWGEYGEACKPQLGAIMTFWRGSKTGWQGHVGFYWGEDDVAYHILGGNQSDAVTITRIGKDRFLASRWPEGYPQTGKVIRLRTNGQPLSVNEA